MNIFLPQETNYEGENLSGLSQIKAGDILLQYRGGLGKDWIGLGIDITQTFSSWFEKLSPKRFWYEKTSGKPTNRPTWLTHAALVTTLPNSYKLDLCALEMHNNESGLELNSLSEKNRDCEYEVFRCRQPEVVQALTVLMSGLVPSLRERTPTTSYGSKSLFKTVISLEKLPTCEQFNVGYSNMIAASKEGVKESYYCSQLIMWFYQGACCKANVKSVWESGDWCGYMSLSDQLSPAQLAMILKANPQFWDHIGKLPAGVR